MSIASYLLNDWFLIFKGTENISKKFDKLAQEIR
tara:strand:- start:27 stop:128 length:102 start_codon:yes stop_codon:yes gene_type:complete